MNGTEFNKGEQEDHNQAKRESKVLACVSRSQAWAKCMIVDSIWLCSAYSHALKVS